MFVCVIIYCHVNYKKAHQHTFSFGRRINTVSSQAFIFYQLVSHVVDTASVAISTLSWEEVGNTTSSWRCCCRAGMSSLGATCWLLGVVEGLHHPVTSVVRACFGKQEVILKYLLSSLLCTVIILEVLHEASLRVTHVARRLGLRSLFWIIESCCRGVRIRGKIVTIFTHRHETCIMLSAIPIKLWNSSHRATSIRELASWISFGFIKRISSAVCSWFPSPRYCCKITSILTINP